VAAVRDAGRDADHVPTQVPERAVAW